MRDQPTPNNDSTRDVDAAAAVKGVDLSELQEGARAMGRAGLEQQRRDVEASLGNTSPDDNFMITDNGKQC